MAFPTSDNSGRSEALDMVTPETLAAVRVLARCDELAGCTSEPGTVTRLSFSSEMGHAHAMVGRWMEEAGLSVHVDELGNIIGRRRAANPSDSIAPVFLMGSHLDSVPDAGKYDGVLGVLLAIEVVAGLGEEPLPFEIHVMGFSDEEGIRYQTPYLGSRAVAGTFEAALLDKSDEDGITLREALDDMGCDGAAWRRSTYAGKPVLGYLEAHIEQGPVLEAKRAPLGIVSAIAGQSRLSVRFCGRAGHAGTQPMNHRNDALTAAAEWVLEVEALACETPGAMATVGSIELHPNASNVVPGEALCSLDLRHGDDETRHCLLERLRAAAITTAKRRKLECEVELVDDHNAVVMDAKLQRRLQSVADAAGIAALPIVSGAGHDAVAMSALTPCAMLFLRTPGGRSHCPEEAVTTNDVGLALRVMRDFLKKTAL